MKVVLFSGGKSLRLPGQAEAVPKPMITVGYRPILWHVMRFYSHWGYSDFVLCLGHKADVVKGYFLRYNEALSNDFVLTKGGRHVELLSTDIHNWRITFADTGLNANVGQRLLAARRYLEGEELFCANYGDALTDAPLPELVADFARQNKVAAFLSVRPRYSFHMVSRDPEGLVTGITDVHGTDLWMNGGYFVFRQEVFDYIREGEDLVEEPFQRLINDDQLLAYRYDGFWMPMDSLKDLQDLQALHDSGAPPWAPWLATAQKRGLSARLHLPG